MYFFSELSDAKLTDFSLSETTDISLYNIGLYFVKDDAHPDSDAGRYVRDTSTSILASSPKDPNLSYVFTGSFCPLARLSLTPFLLGVPLGFEVGRDATGLLNSVALTHAPATFSFPAGAQNWTLIQPQGSKSGARERNWVQHLETQIFCPFAKRTRTVPGRRSRPADFPEEAWVLVNTDPGPPETQLE